MSRELPVWALCTQCSVVITHAIMATHTTRISTTRSTTVTAAATASGASWPKSAGCGQVAVKGLQGKPQGVQGTFSRFSSSSTASPLQPKLPKTPQGSSRAAGARTMAPRAVWTCMHACPHSQSGQSALSKLARMNTGSYACPGTNKTATACWM